MPPLGELSSQPLLRQGVNHTATNVVAGHQSVQLREGVHLTDEEGSRPPLLRPAADDDVQFAADIDSHVSALLPALRHLIVCTTGIQVAVRELAAGRDEGLPQVRILELPLTSWSCVFAG